MIPGFNKAVIGLDPGEETVVRISPEGGFGQYDEGMISSLTREKVPEWYKAEVGKPLDIKDENGRQVPAVIKEITDEYLVLDMNHPLAGKEIVLRIRVLEIKK